MPNTYTTKQGETWDQICFAVYGSEYVLDKLIAANIDYRKTMVFDAGVVLSLPSIDVATVEEDTNLPPWKRDSEVM